MKLWKTQAEQLKAVIQLCFGFVATSSFSCSKYIRLFSAKKAEPQEVTKPDSKPSPPPAKKPIMPESKKPMVVEQEKTVNQETTKPEFLKPDLPKPELPRPDLPKPELPRPDLPKPEFKKPPPPVSKSKPVPPKPSVVTKPPVDEPQRTNSFRNILNNSLAERGRIPSINKKPPARPPADASLHANQPHEVPVSKESAPPRPEKPKHEPEKKIEKDVKTEGMFVTLLVCHFQCPLLARIYS